MLLLVSIGTALVSFNLPKYLIDKGAYLWHIRFLSLSIFLFSVFVMLSILRETIFCIVVGFFTAMVLNWGLSCWVFNPFEMGTNQVVFGWCLAFALVAIPIVRAVRENNRIKEKRKRNEKCTNDAKAKYRQMKRELDVMRGKFEDLTEKTTTIESRLNSI